MDQTAPGLKIFLSEGCRSYLVFDRSTREAAVIDPHVGLVDDYRDYIAEHRLKPVWALDTHTHADHFSATHWFKKEYKARIAMGEATQSHRPDVRLGDRRALALGRHEIEVLSTPGHTPDSVCYRISNLVFTGDVLLIGATGRTDFPGADAGQEWASAHEILLKLPADTVVFPGHDYGDRLFSTIAVEAARNPQLKPARIPFVEMKNAERMTSPDAGIGERVRFNTDAYPPEVSAESRGAAAACGVGAPAEVPGAAIDVKDYALKIKAGAAGSRFIDVREETEFKAGHIPGTRNIPLSELALHLRELAGSQTIYVSCQSGRRSGLAAKTLSYLALPGVVNVTGGYKAWSGAALPTEK